jgi:hypothetical protein
MISMDEDKWKERQKKPCHCGHSESCQKCCVIAGVAKTVISCLTRDLLKKDYLFAGGWRIESAMIEIAILNVRIIYTIQDILLSICVNLLSLIKQS